MPRFAGMGPRAWAAIGNVLRITAVFGYLGGALAAYRAAQLYQMGAPGALTLPAVALTIATFVVAFLFWNAKGPLVSGNLIVRLVVGVWVLLSVISSLGLDLIFIGIVYLFTAEPDSSEVFRKGKTPKPRFTPPADWLATGRVGPSGAMVYSNAHRETSLGMIDSWVPVQVMDKSNGYAKVVAATGEGGWIDARTLTEGV